MRTARTVACALAGVLLVAASALAAHNDFNRDGNSDVLWHNQATGELFVWLMRGNVAVSGSHLTPDRLADPLWQVRGVADLNYDGSADVLWHHQGTGELYVWYLDGLVTVRGAYMSPRSFSDTRWQIRGLADFNADGKPDVLWHHQVTGELYVWFLNGVGTVSGAYLTPRAFTDTRWQIRGLADFNGGAQTDILWHNSVGGDLYVWCLNRTTVDHGVFVRPRVWDDLNWEVVEVGEFNSDGKADVLWRNRLFGYLYLWYLDGTVSGPGAYLTPQAYSDGVWKVVPR